MKQYLLVCCLFLSTISLSQNIVDEAAKEPIRNQNGDPTTNIIDPNGSRQGDWFYVDHLGNDVIKQSFTNNTLQSTYVKMNSEWVKVSKLNHLDDLKDILRQEGVEPSEKQQILITIDKNDAIQIHGLGSWNENQIEQSINIISKTLRKNSTKLKQTSYIIL